MNNLPTIIRYQEQCFAKMRELGCKGIFIIKGHAGNIVPPSAFYFRNLKANNDNSPQV